MKYLILTATLFIATISIGQIGASFDIKRFYAPGNGHYLETYLSIKAASIKYKANDNNRLQGNVSVTQIIWANDSVVAYDKADVKSPVIGTDSIAHDFIDMKRFPLKPGIYKLELVLKDNNSNEEPVYVNQPFTIKALPADPTFSDVELLAQFTPSTAKTEFTKSGYEMVPHVSNYYPNTLGKIAYYTETYGLDKVVAAGERVSSFQYIEKQFSGTKMTGYHKFRKFTAAPVNAIFNTIDIEDLPTGDYNLVFQIRGTGNKLLAERKIAFVRSNPQNALAELNSLDEINFDGSFADKFETEDSINEALRSMIPIVTNLDRNLIDNKLEGLDLETKKKFFYNYWHSRYDLNDQAKWEEYNTQVQKTNELFGTSVMKGYQTDRGRIYLKFGAPNTMTDRTSNMAYYPYQIWHYYKLGQFSDKKFIFYNRDQVTNDFQLLHSNLRGERQNSKWEIELSKPDSPFESIDATAPSRVFHGESPRDLWNNPR